MIIGRICAFCEKEGFRNKIHKINNVFCLMARKEKYAFIQLRNKKKRGIYPQRRG